MAAFTNEDLEFYATQHAATGALDAAFTTYRMFEDARQNREWREEKGNVGVRAMMMSGEHVYIIIRAEEIAREYYKDLELGVVEGYGHYLAEENPEGFIGEVLRFIKKR